MLRPALSIALVVLLASCGGQSDVSADVVGSELFGSRVLGGQAGCVTCHSLTPDRVVVGPSLAGVGQRAASRVSDQSVREYLRTSIVMPDAYVVDGFASGRMPSNWADVLTDAEIEALVDYLEDL